jgi:hypothetical protein
VEPLYVLIGGLALVALGWALFFAIQSRREPKAKR